MTILAANLKQYAQRHIFLLALNVGRINIVLWMTEDAAVLPQTDIYRDQCIHTKVNKQSRRDPTWGSPMHAETGKHGTRII